MDWSWTSGFWVFPLLCMVFMLAMILIMFRHGGGCMPFRGARRSGDRAESPQRILQRRYASGEIGKEQYEALRRDLNQSGTEA